MILLYGVGTDTFYNRNFQCYIKNRIQMYDLPWNGVFVDFGMRFETRIYGIVSIREARVVSQMMLLPQVAPRGSAAICRTDSDGRRASQ